jgi:hypothetical protein
MVKKVENEKVYMKYKEGPSVNKEGPFVFDT